VIGVEPAAVKDPQQSLRAGHIVTIAPPDTHRRWRAHHVPRRVHIGETRSPPPFRFNGNLTAPVDCWNLTRFR